MKEKSRLNYSWVDDLIHRNMDEKNYLEFSLSDLLKAVLILLISTFVGIVFRRFGFTEANIIMVYILGVILTALVTTHQIYSLVMSLVSVFVFNFFFTEPRFTLLAHDIGYPITFLIMFFAAFVTSSLVVRLKEHAKQSSESAYRTQILLETSQLLQQVKEKEEIIQVTAGQMLKLLNRSVVIYLEDKERLGNAQVFRVNDRIPEDTLTDKSEKKVAEWVLNNNERAGSGTDLFADARCLYLSIRINEQVYGVAGIDVSEKPLDTFEKNLMLSILGESALALESEKNAREKEEAAILAENERLRANLLRAISHDLRTPLTAISGNASNLMSNGAMFDEETKQQLYADIYDDSMWLINLVENLLAVTRIEDGRMQLKLTTELMDEVVTEALSHVHRKKGEHPIHVVSREDFLFAKIDARLMVQVIINLVDNAVKYTPPETEIEIRMEKKEDKVILSVRDQGPGIPDSYKSHVFDMFFTGENKISDNRRSLGLGLALCKSIVNAHGGEICVSDAVPHGAVFTFSLPAGEVQLHE